MKSLLRFVFASVLLVPAALTAASFEGKVTFKMSTPRGQPQEMSYAIKGQKMRMETGDKKAIGAVIMDLSQKQMMMMMDEQKMYTVMAIPDMVEDTVQKQTDDVKLEKTNETEKILGYTATKYLATHGNDKSELWLAEGLGTYMAFNQNSMGGRRGGGQAAKGWERALAGKELFPLRVVGLDRAGKENFRMEVTAINKQSLPDSLFTPPAGYQKFDMGGMLKGLIPGSR